MIAHFVPDILYSTHIDLATAIIRLIESFFLGALIGAERQFRRREAGIRTFTLICMGSTAAMLVSIWIPQTYPHLLNGDPGRIAAQVLTGIGFLGAGAIIQSHGSIHGLTTAACIWVVAVIGLTIGAGMHLVAVVTTLLMLFILISLELLEKRMLLDGVNKILTLMCRTDSPEVEPIQAILKEHGIYVISMSQERDYDRHTATLMFKVNLQAHSETDSKLFADLQALNYVCGIKLLA